MTRKKIIFVIVEGPSDEQALGAILGCLYDKNTVHVQIMHYDITTQLNVNPGNIVSKVGNIVRDYAGRIFKPNDFAKIIHITDMDGAFIPDSNVIEDMTSKKPLYLTTEIRTCNKAGIENRNQHKRENLNRLVSVSKVWDVPYQIYYMSCNLDHALYGKLNTTNDEKDEDSLQFANEYKDDIPAFLHFISASEFSVMCGYIKSWQYIKEGLHSLERHTNLGLCFKPETVGLCSKPDDVDSENTSPPV